MTASDYLVVERLEAKAEKLRAEIERLRTDAEIMTRMLRKVEEHNAHLQNQILSARRALEPKP